MGKKILIIILVVVGAIGFGIWKTVGVVSKGGELGDAAVETFHARFNAGQDDEIRKAAAPAFQTEVPLEKLQSILTPLRAGLGKFQSTSRTNVNVNNQNGHTTLTVDYTSKYERTEATEQFIFDYNGDLPLLLSFDIKSVAGKGANEVVPVALEK